MSIVYTSSTGMSGADGSSISTSSISTPDINVSNTMFHGALQVDINEGLNSVSQSDVILGHATSFQLDHGASFWVF